MMTRLFAAAIILLVSAAPGALRPATGAAGSLRGYARELPPETAADREDRHRRVAARRAQPVVVICHRGFSTLARENTLDAYQAAMDYGADGCEIDVRRTADGVVVLFHDDMLDRLTEGLGAVPEVTYFELLSYRPRPLSVSLGASSRPPTLAAVLALARQRAMLLHLDVKESGLDALLARTLDAADMWDHVSAVNSTTAPELARDPRVKPLRFKGPGLFEGRKDLDPASVRAQLALPGQAVMVDDPRLVVRELGRPSYAPVPLPGRLTEMWSPGPLAGDPAAGSRVAGSLRGRSLDASPAILRSRLLSVPNGAPVHGREIVDRAWSAWKLEEICCPTRATVTALEAQVRARSLHPDWRYHGLDGAIAARTLGKLGGDRSAEVLVEALRRVDPALEQVVNRSFGPYPLAWTDFRVKMHAVTSLGQLRSRAGKRFLWELVHLEDAAARELMPDYRAEAVQALFRHSLTPSELDDLLRSPHLGVRGAAILECLDRPTSARRAALRRHAPWALQLPTAGSAR